MKLKPETPLQTKRRIMHLEDECKNLEERAWKLTIAVEVIAIAALLMCVVHFKAMYG